MVLLVPEPLITIFCFPSMDNVPRIGKNPASSFMVSLAQPRLALIANLFQIQQMQKRLKNENY